MVVNLFSFNSFSNQIASYYPGGTFQSFLSHYRSNSHLASLIVILYIHLNYFLYILIRLTHSETRPIFLLWFSHLLSSIEILLFRLRQKIKTVLTQVLIHTIYSSWTKWKKIQGGVSHFKILTHFILLFYILFNLFFYFWHFFIKFLTYSWNIRYLVDILIN